MDKTFNNTSAAICGVLAILEVISVIVYIVVTTIRLRRKIISMGRLIPTIHMVVVGSGTIPPNQVVQVYQPQPQPVPPPQQPGFYPSGPYQAAPSAPGFYQAQDNPPTYNDATKN